MSGRRMGGVQGIQETNANNAKSRRLRVTMLVRRTTLILTRSRFSKKNSTAFQSPPPLSMQTRTRIAIQHQPFPPASSTRKPQGSLHSPRRPTTTTTQQPTSHHDLINLRQQHRSSHRLEGTRQIRRFTAESRRCFKGPTDGLFKRVVGV